MKVIRDPGGLNKILRKISGNKKSIGFVPTMGDLHPGHLSLIKQALQENDLVVVSIFVNPAQFGPKEDFRKYPRPLKHDLALCRASGVDFVFLPDNKIIYPWGYSTFVDVEGLSSLLCGSRRIGHFRGVTTVMAKLLNIVGPCVLYLGQKDAQQAIVIKRMAEDLNMSVEIKVMPIVREKDGLAMSSRNVYLNRKERSQAQSIYKALKSAKELFDEGERDSKKIINKIKRIIDNQLDAKIDYASIVDAKDLRDIKKISRQALAAVAVKVGKTRLIDNIVLN